MLKIFIWLFDLVLPLWIWLTINSFGHFADDTTVFPSDSEINNVHATVNMELVGVDNLLKVNRLSLNVSKTSYMMISNRKNAFEIRIRDSILQKSQLPNSLALHLMKTLLLMTM